LARACEVSRRTTFRNLEALRSTGVALKYDERQQRYRMPQDGFLPSTHFTPEQVTVSELGQISWWILGDGDQAEVLRPPELRRIIAEHAAHMAQRYAQGPAGPG